MMIDTQDGRLVLVADRFFDAQVYPTPKVLVTFRASWYGWETLTQGDEYYVFTNDTAGEEALLKIAILYGISIECGRLKLVKPAGNTPVPE